jgi:hypothetical protein
MNIFKFIESFTNDDLMPKDLEEIVWTVWQIKKLSISLYSFGLSTLQIKLLQRI